MRVLRIFLSKESDGIKVGVSVCVGINYYGVSFPTIKDRLLENVFYSNSAEVITLLNRVECPKSRFNQSNINNIAYKNSLHTAQFAKVYYSLPLNPNIAIDFLSIMDVFVKMNCFNAVQICNEDFDIHHGMSLDNQIIDGVVDLSRDSVSRLIAQKFLTMKVDKSYSKVTAALEDFLLNKLPPAYDMENGKISTIRYYHSAFNLKQLVELKDNLWLPSEGVDRFKAFAIIIKNNYAASKFRFLAPSIGKLADDGGKYSMRYTEIDLMNRAVFHIRKDGLVGVNWQDNPGYQKNYAVGERNHNILEKELTHLAPLLNLEFMPGINFHEGLVFNSACSKRLIAQGLHLNLQYVKNYFSAKNAYQTVYSFFRSKYAADNMWHGLPDDVLNEISSVHCGDKIKKLVIEDRAIIQQAAQSRISVLK